MTSSRCSPPARTLGALAALAVLVAAGAPAVAADTNAHVGSVRCAGCHATEAERWRGSHHDLAMAEASEETVLGDFDDATFTAQGVTTRFFRDEAGGFRVRTDGPDGALDDYPVTHTFGWYPLQQYLVPFPGGRLQPLGIAWDARPENEGGQRWYHLYPDDAPKPGDPLHWTGRDQTWNHQCAECHSTNLEKGYDLATDAYETTWSEIDVACEACHGPGEKHVAWADGPEAARAADPSAALAVDLAAGTSWSWDAAAGKPARTEPAPSAGQVQTCARCHARRGQVWGEYTHGRPLADTHRLSLLDEELYFVDGQIRDEVYVLGSFLQSRMHQAGVVCSDCHDPHALTLRAEGNALCTRCHVASDYDTSTHHHHADGSAGAACTACHMPERTYMGIDARADHSLRIPRPDLAARLGTPDACSGCHDDRDAGWAARTVEGWTGGVIREAHFATAFDARAGGAPGADAALLSIASDTSRPAIVRTSAFARLAEPGTEAAFANRARLIADPDPLVREAAARSLEQVDLRTRAEQGWQALDDPVRGVRLAATRALAPLARERLPEPLRAALSRSLDEYFAAMRWNADRPETHLDLGFVATELRQARAAEAAYRTALRLDPTFTPGYVNLADLNRALGREDEAERVLRTGLAAVPDAAPLHHALGLTLVRDGRLAEALAPLGESARLAPGSARFALVYGIALRDSGNVERGLAALERGHAIAPRDRDLLAALAATYAAAGNAERAAHFARLRETLDGTSPGGIRRP